ncbi:MAG: hypothetical protein KAJ24_04180 [Candidatus Aenigmarchaeota archaeon]|nr:hypothetical protein [Candidatus Aenigmarchaeota archaeon]
MAKSIRATPELRGWEADEFLRKMHEREKAPITKRTIKLARRLEAFKL